MKTMLEAIFKLVSLLVKVYLAFMVISILCFAFVLVTAIGENSIVNETIHLSPGDAKTYYLPPGMTYIRVSTDVPINERDESLTGQGTANGLMNSKSGHGTPFVTNCTFTNPGNTEATVNVSISTGVLNPFGYLW
jgi:hypothetical protein